MATKTKEPAGDTMTLEPKDTGKLPATTPTAPGGAVSARAQRMAADAGKGISKNRDDKIVPMVRVLQGQSKAVLKNKAEYVEGAEPGDFLLRNTLNPVVKGDQGLEVQPCAFLRCWLAFDGPADENPNFMGRYEDAGNKPKGVDGLKLDDNGYDWIDPAGNRYTFSREHYVLINGMPFVIPFGGSGHTTSREWQTVMEQFRLPSGAVEPSWNRKYIIKTVPKSDKKGHDWFGISVKPIPGEVTDDEYERGAAFYNTIEAGEARAEAPEAGKTNDEVPF